MDNCRFRAIHAGIVLAVLGYGDEKSALAIVERFKGLPVLLLAMKEPVPRTRRRSRLRT